jgi:hypothetical protein
VWLSSGGRNIFQEQGWKWNLHTWGIYFMGSRYVSLAVIVLILLQFDFLMIRTMLNYTLWKMWWYHINFYKNHTYSHCENSTLMWVLISRTETTLSLQFGSKLFSSRRNAETVKWVVAKRRKCIYYSEWKYSPSLPLLCLLVYMLISFRICQVLPNGNIIHKVQILSMSQNTGC